MKQIICVNPKGYNLTEGREYTTRGENDNAPIYSIVNDRGLVRNYDSSLFTDLVVEPVERDLTTQEMIDRMIRDVDDEDRVIITVPTRIATSNDRVSAQVVLLWRYDESHCDISCGIRQLYNINDLYTSISRSEISDTNVRTRMFRQAILTAINEMEDTALVLVSTAVNTMPQVFLEVLDDLAISTADSINPNSRNPITLWVLEGNRYQAFD